MTFAVTDAAERAGCSAMVGLHARDAVDARDRLLDGALGPRPGRDDRRRPAGLPVRLRRAAPRADRVAGGRRQRRVPPGRREARLPDGGHPPGRAAAPRRAAGRLGRPGSCPGSSPDARRAARGSASPGAEGRRRAPHALGGATTCPAIVELPTTTAAGLVGSLRDVRTIDDARRWLAERPRRRTGSTGRSATRRRGPLDRPQRAARVPREPPVAPRSATACTPAHRRRACASAAVATAATRRRFEELALRRIELVHDVGNVGVLRGGDPRRLRPRGRRAGRPSATPTARSPTCTGTPGSPPTRPGRPRPRRSRWRSRRWTPRACASGRGATTRPRRSLAAMTDPLRRPAGARRRQPLDARRRAPDGWPVPAPRARRAVGGLGRRGGRRARRLARGCATSTRSTGARPRRTGRCPSRPRPRHRARALGRATDVRLRRARPAPGAAAARAGQHGVLPGRREGRLRAGGRSSAGPSCSPTGFVDEHLHARVSRRASDGDRARRDRRRRLAAAAAVGRTRPPTRWRCCTTR